MIKEGYVDYAQFTEWMNQVFRSTDTTKRVAAPMYCSEIASGVVLGFWETPDKPHVFLGQRSFATLMPMYRLD